MDRAKPGSPPCCFPVVLDLESVYSTHSADKGEDFGYVHIQYNPMEMTLVGKPEVKGNADIYV